MEKTRVKAIRDFGEIEKDKEYYIAHVVPSSQIVVVSDIEGNVLKGGVHPRYVFDISITEALEIFNRER